MLIFRHFPYWILIIVSYLEYSKLQLRTCDITLETKYCKNNLTIFISQYLWSYKIDTYYEKKKTLRISQKSFISLKFQ